MTPDIFSLNPFIRESLKKIPFPISYLCLNNKLCWVTRVIESHVSYLFYYYIFLVINLDQLTVTVLDIAEKLIFDWGQNKTNKRITCQIKFDWNFLWLETTKFSCLVDFTKFPLSHPYPKKSHSRATFQRSVSNLRLTGQVIRILYRCSVIKKSKHICKKLMWTVGSLTSFFRRSETQPGWQCMMRW